MIHERELYGATERVGRVVFLLMQGRSLTVNDVRSLTGLGFPGAWRLLVKASRVIPLVESEGAWSIMPDALPRSRRASIAPD